MTKIASVIILTALLLLTIGGTKLVNQARANPYKYSPHVTMVSPPAGTQAPIISIHTPQNGSSYPRNIIPLTFDVIIPHTKGDKSVGWIQKLYYKTSWESKEIQIVDRSFVDNTSFSINLYSTLGGNLSVTIYAVGGGEYETRPSELTDKVTINYYHDRFEMKGSSTVSFTQDFFPPKISVLSPQNRSYDASDVELNLTANEALSQILYCLDENQNHTITGNVTLTGLTNGAHNVTVYAADLAGNKAVSETISFSVKKPEPFPTIPVAVTSGASLAIIGVGLLVYFKKRKY
jgi:hypothetical protein